MNIKLLGITLAVAILCIVVELTRREKLTFKYAAIWLMVSFAAVFFAVFDELLFKIAYAFGFKLPSNFIFFVLMTAFVFITLLMTIFLCQQNRRNDKMAQRLAMLEFELEELRKGSGSDEKIA